MLSVQPTGLHHYLTRRSLTVPKHLGHFFYMTWEDALWDLLAYFHIPQKSRALVPEFFCGDVVTNMKTHGIQSYWYPCDQNFQTDPHVFKAWLIKHQPHIVVILHAAGITNQLFAKKDIWIDALPKNAILIEDSVHRIVDPRHIQLIAPRHLVIDSLRKVVPLPGSNLYGSQEVLAQLKTTPTQKAFLYQLSVMGWWMLFQGLLTLKWYSLAEKAMIIGYDIIGDHPRGGVGWSIAKFFAQHLNIMHIEKAKQQQVTLYKKHLSPIWENPTFFLPHFSWHDYGKLRGFPIGVRLQHSQSFLQSLRSQGLLVRYELNDSIWSTKNKVLYLPLGPYLKNSDIPKIARAVRNAAKNLD